MIILGIGGILKDTACAVLKDGKLAAAIEQFKIARHDGLRHLPEETIAACLSLAGSSADAVNCVAIVRPLAHDADQTILEQCLHPNLRADHLLHHSGFQVDGPLAKQHAVFVWLLHEA